MHSLQDLEICPLAVRADATLAQLVSQCSALHFPGGIFDDRKVSFRSSVLDEKRMKCNITELAIVSKVQSGVCCWQLDQLDKANM